LNTFEQFGKVVKINYNKSENQAKIVYESKDDLDKVLAEEHSIDGESVYVCSQEQHDSRVARLADMEAASFRILKLFNIPSYSVKDVRSQLDKFGEIKKFSVKNFPNNLSSIYLKYQKLKNYDDAVEFLTNNLFEGKEISFSFDEDQFPVLKRSGTFNKISSQRAPNHYQPKFKNPNAVANNYSSNFDNSNPMEMMAKMFSFYQAQMLNQNANRPFVNGGNSNFQNNNRFGSKGHQNGPYARPSHRANKPHFKKGPKPNFTSQVQKNDGPSQRED